MMKKSRIGIILATLISGFAASPAWAQSTVNFWYHFDNPESTKLMDELVAGFEGKNPGIKVKAENIPWNNYYDKLFTSIVGGKAPDARAVVERGRALVRAHAVGGVGLPAGGAVGAELLSPGDREGAHEADAERP